MERGEALLVFEHWYDRQKYKNISVPKGTIAGALVVLERLSNAYDLNLDEHLTPGGAQVKGASGSKIKLILNGFGETRHFVSEGGRTNRGLRLAIKSMLDTLTTMNLEQLPHSERNGILQTFQLFLVQRIREFHSKERLKPIYDSTMSTWQFISNILELARSEGKSGQVAQHLVGAKLQLRFPQEHIGKESYSIADVQTGRSGDFKVGNTVFHVTMAPAPGVYDKCERNLQEGLRPYLLVPYSQLVGVKQNIEASVIGKGRISAEAIESFVSQNIEELASFSTHQLEEKLSELLLEYNNRVDEAEADKSLLFQIPQNLLRKPS